MKILSLASVTPACLAALMLAAGCGGTVVEGSGGSGNSAGSAGSSGDAGAGAGGSTTTSTSTTVVPPECAVEGAGAGPYPVAFHFTNPGADVLYLHQDCLLQYSITACDSGYGEGLSLSGACTVDCSEMNDCIQCGPCPDMGVQVVNGSPLEDGWSGHTYTFSQTSSGCSCHVEHVAPAQKYRITVPVFASEQDATMGKVLFEASVDFSLPTPGGIVDVPLVKAP